MSSLTTTWCPNSFQLRLALRSKKPCAVNFAGMRFGKLDYRGVRLVSFNVKNSNVSNGSGAGVEKTSGGDNSSAVEDGFAGWSGNDGAQKPNDSQGKQNIAGECVKWVIISVGNKV